LLEKYNTVDAESKCPKAEGIACPRADEYNDRITVKEKDAPINVYLFEQVHWRHPHTKKQHGHCIKL
jgi:hypothetical protein